MAEYIGCRNCNSPDCKGCNLKILETMLNNGKFDCLMNANRCINPAADVAPVRHGRWEWSKDYDGDSILVCSECGRVCHEEDAPYCYCGAKMDLEAEDA